MISMATVRLGALHVILAACIAGDILVPACQKSLLSWRTGFVAANMYAPFSSAALIDCAFIETAEYATWK